jgi:hypothetical protein
LKSPKKIAKLFRYIARTILLIISSFLFLFGLLSGSERYGGGIKGILINSPNALPWLLLFAFVYVAWRWELIGGILLSITGIFTIFFFDASLFVILIISLPLIVLGLLLILSWYITRKRE